MLSLQHHPKALITMSDLQNSAMILQALTVLILLCLMTDCGILKATHGN